TDGDGVLTPGEAWTTTAADGTFTLNGGTGNLVMVGGTDVSTGLPFLGTLTAPSDSTVITPLTTLVVALAASSDPADVPIAPAQVAAAFGLDPSINLQSYD